MKEKTRLKFGLLVLAVMVVMSALKADSAWGIHIVAIYAIYVGGKSFTNKAYIKNGN